MNTTTIVKYSGVLIGGIIAGLIGSVGYLKMNPEAARPDPFTGTQGAKLENEITELRTETRITISHINSALDEIKRILREEKPPPYLTDAVNKNTNDIQTLKQECAILKNQRCP